MGGSAQFVYVARRINPSVWTRITKDMVLGPLVASKAIEPQPEPRRVYPKGGLGAQIVGVSGDGLSGVELSRNDALSARDGKALISKANDRPNGDTHWARVLHVREPRPGKAIQLTLDSRIQWLVQKRSRRRSKDWHAKAVTAVVLDTRTGGILAMASAPGVPPAGYRAGNPDEWRLRAITDLYEPGSTFKLVTFMGALQEGVITPDTMFHVKDSNTAYDRTIPDAHPHPVENWTATDILAHSSNVGTITIATNRLHTSRLQKWIHLTGFGNATGVDLPGEEPGKVLDDDKWYGTAILNVPIGEGIAVTPLQMAALYGSVANGGLWVQPHVTASIGGKATTGWKTKQLVSRQSPQSCAPCSPRSSTSNGTGVQARVPGYSVAGKTGTTPKYNPKTTRTAIRTRRQCQYQTSFVGFAPAKHPRFVALVMVDEPKDAKGRPRTSRAATSPRRRSRHRAGHPADPARRARPPGRAPT